MKRAHPRLMRWIGYPLVGLLIVCGAAAILLATGWPQHFLLEQGLSRALGAQVKVEGVSLGREMQVQNIAVYDADSVQLADPPAIGIRSLSVRPNVALGRAEGLFQPSATIEDLRVHLEKSSGNASNYGFLTRMMEQDASEPSDAAMSIPSHDVQAGNLSLRLIDPRYQVALDRIQANYTHHPPKADQLRVSGDAVQGFVRHVDAGTEISFEDGMLDVTAAFRDSSFRISPLEAHLPGLLEVQGEVRVDPDAISGELAAINLDTAAIEALDLRTLPFYPLPIHFSRLDASGSSVNILQGPLGYALIGTQVRIDAEQLVAGPENAPWFAGDLQLTAKGEGRDAEGDLQLGGGQRLRLSGSWYEGIKGEAALEDWTSSELQEAFPPQWRSHVATISGLERISATAQLSANMLELDLQGDLTPRFSGDEGAPVAAPTTWTGYYALLSSAMGIDFETKLGQGTVTGSFKHNSGAPLGGTTKFDTFDMVRALHLAGIGLSEAIKPGGYVTGTVDTTFLSERLDVEFALEGEPGPLLPIEALQSQPMTLAGSLAAGADDNLVSGGNLSGTLGSHLSLDATGFQVSSTGGEGSPVSLRSALAFEGDLGAWAGYLELGVWTGELEGTLDAEYTDAMLRGPLTLIIGGLGYDWLAFPYSTGSRVGGDLVLDTRDFSGSLNEAYLEVESGTRLSVPRIALAQDPLSVELRGYELESDGLALIAAGLLDGISGSIHITGDAVYTPEAPNLEATYECKLDSLTFRDALAALAGVEASGQVGFEDGSLSGDGQFASNEIAAAGVALHNVSGPIRFREERVVLDETEAGLYGGKAFINAEASLFQHGLPLTASARLRGIDLARFTEEFEPPNLTLTGIANGHIQFEGSVNDIADMKLHLRSTENFTINRDIVRQLLLSEYAQGATGGKRLDAIVLEALGDAEQRPFDAMEMDLEYREDAFEGQVVFRSKAINLTISLNLDAATIAELFILRQEGLLDQISGVQLEPNAPAE